MRCDFATWREQKFLCIEAQVLYVAPRGACAREAVGARGRAPSLPPDLLARLVSAPLAATGTMEAIQRR